MSSNVLQHPAFPVTLNAFACARVSIEDQQSRKGQRSTGVPAATVSCSGSGIPRHSRGGAPTEFGSDPAGATNRGSHEIFLKRCCEICRTLTAAVQQNDLALGGVDIANALVQGHQRKMAYRSIKLDAFRVYAHQDEYQLAGMFFLVVGRLPQLRCTRDRIVSASLRLLRSDAPRRQASRIQCRSNEPEQRNLRRRVN
jgi:hypothetical protein